MLILIRGLPGSGKSTFAQYLLSLLGGVGEHLEADMYFEIYNDDVFDSRLLQEAHTWCQNHARAALLRGEMVIVSNTFSRIWEMQPYIDFARAHDIEFKVLTCEGNYGNLHYVPQQTIEKMRARWEKWDG